MIVMCFDHLSEVHAHMSSFVANMLLLAKICDPEMYDMVLKATARPMIQINIPECYLSLVQDPPQKTMAEEKGWHSSRRFGFHEQHVLQENQDSDPPGFSQQLFGVTQMEVLQWWHSQRSMHPHLRFRPSSCQSYCWESVPWWHWWNYKGKHKRSHTTVHEGNLAGEDTEPPTKK